MNNRSLRAFSLGILLTVSAVFSFSLLDDSTKTITNNEAKEQLNKSGYEVLTKSELAQLLETDETLNENKKTTTEETPVSKTTKKTEKAQNTATTKTDKSVITYHLYINEGVTTSQITEQLVEAKIIKDQQEFETYLIKNNYHTRIQLGKFKLTNEMSYRQIAKIITN